MATNREPSRFQLPQVPNTATDNCRLDPDGFHSSRHDPTRHSAILTFRLLNNNDGPGTGRIRCSKLAHMVYPMLSRWKPMLLGIFYCNQWRAVIFG